MKLVAYTEHMICHSSDGCWGPTCLSTHLSLWLFWFLFFFAASFKALTPATTTSAEIDSSFFPIGSAALASCGAVAAPSVVTPCDATLIYRQHRTQW